MFSLSYSRISASHHRVVRRWLVSLATIIGLALPASSSAAGALADAAACPGSQAGCVRMLLRTINHDRALYGFLPVRLAIVQSQGTGSCVGSYGHSSAMALTLHIWHTNRLFPWASFPRNVCTHFSVAGENVGESNSGSEQEDLETLNRAMMSEPYGPKYCGHGESHVCIILCPCFHRVGIGIYQAHGATWLTEDFTN